MCVCVCVVDDRQDNVHARRRPKIHVGISRAIFNRSTLSTTSTTTTTATISLALFK